MRMYVPEIKIELCMYRTCGEKKDKKIQDFHSQVKVVVHLQVKLFLRLILWYWQDEYKLFWLPGCFYNTLIESA